MVKVEGEIVINRPIDDVFSFVADQRNEPLYNPQMRRAEKITEGPVGIGTRFRVETDSWGRPVEMVIEVTSYEPPWQLKQSTTMSSMNLRGGLTFDSIPEGTRMRWSWELEPRGILKLMSPLVALMGRRQEQTIWTGLKRFLEEQQPAENFPSERVVVAASALAACGCLLVKHRLLTAAET